MIRENIPKPEKSDIRREAASGKERLKQTHYSRHTHTRLKTKKRFLQCTQPQDQSDNSWRLQAWQEKLESSPSKSGDADQTIRAPPCRRQKRMEDVEMPRSLSVRCCPC
ncbi:unnamed protein product [Clavelina lepadiformis]|uniref:Uncharacterized protein n=1 Tax=Clavelina lepadiformis TaxID=159417 RepID=A0ABP0GTP7_CLALP